jgi:hypothetical protein
LEEELEDVKDENVEGIEVFEKSGGGESEEEWKEAGRLELDDKEGLEAYHESTSAGR